MARDARSLSRRARLVLGLGCIALGCYPIALGLGFLPADGGAAKAPLWIVAGAGLVFVIAGLMILLADHARANDLLAGVLLLLFGIIGAWASLFSSSEGFSGGLPFLSRDLNTLIGRWIFGLGALICFAMCGYAFWRAASRST